MNRVLIIGAGWLGEPLAHCLSHSNEVMTTNRTLRAPQGNVLRAGLDLAAVEDSTFPQAIIDFQPNVIIGCFPPGFRHQAQDNLTGNPYLANWQVVVDLAKQFERAPLVMMISSTAVYPERAGMMSESDTSLELDNEVLPEKARKLLEAEQSVVDSGFPYCVLRCAGLIGPLRHPARFAARLKQVSQLAPANMVHLDDVIGAIEHCMALGLEQGAGFAEVVNVTSPVSHSKAEFYRAAIEAAGSDVQLPPVVEVEGKGISAEKLLGRGYQFRYRDSLDAMRAIDVGA